SELDDRDDHPDQDEHDDRELRPDPDWRHARGTAYRYLRLRPSLRCDMTRRLLTLATMLAVGLLLPAWLGPASDASGRASARQALAPPLGGVNIPGLDSGSTPQAADREIVAAKALHAAIVRVAVPWSVLEPFGPGRISGHALAFTDRLISDAAAAGI